MSICFPPHLSDTFSSSSSSPLIRAVLAAFFLHEKLGIVGKVGCALCLIGSVVIVLHAPEDKAINSVDEILNYALQPGKHHSNEHTQSKEPCIFFNLLLVHFTQQACGCGQPKQKSVGGESGEEAEQDGWPVTQSN
jgi:hypothetical protein